MEKPSISVLDGDRDMESSVFFHHRCACFDREINSISFEISSFDFKVLCKITWVYIISSISKKKDEDGEVKRPRPMSHKKLVSYPGIASYPLHCAVTQCCYIERSLMCICDTLCSCREHSAFEIVTAQIV